MRIALRQLFRRPGFTATAVLSMSLGIALNALMAAVVDALRRPQLLVPNPEKLFVMMYRPGEGGRHDRLLTFETIRQRAHAIGGLADWRSYQEPVLTPAGLEQFEVTHADASYFVILGSRPASGRLALTQDEIARGEVVAVLSSRFARRYSSNTSAAQSVTVNGLSTPVIGTVDFSAAVPRTSDIWLLQSKPTLRSPMLLARANGVSDTNALRIALESVRRELDGLTNPGGERGSWYIDRLVQTSYEAPRFVLGVFGAMLALLLIAAGNLASLQLAHVVRARREYALRSVLGASRWHLASAASMEVLLVSAVGFLFGMLLCGWSLQLLDAYMPTTGEYAAAADARLNLRVVGLATLLTLLASAFVAVAPAFIASRETHLTSNTYTRSTRVVARIFAGLLVFETALSLGLLTASGVLLRAAWKVVHVEWGYDADPLLTAEARLPPVPGGRTAAISTDSLYARQLLHTALVDAHSMPGVVDAAMIRYGGAQDFTVTVTNGAAGTSEKILPHFQYQAVSSNMLRVFRIPISRGRDFDEADGTHGGAVIVDGETANFFWPGQNPIGNRLKLGPLDSQRPWHEVIGVTKPALFQMREASLGPPPAIFVAVDPLAPAAGVTSYSARIVYRSSAPNVTLKSLQRASSLPAAGVTLARPRLWHDFTGLSSARRTQFFVLFLFGGFAFAGVVLSMIGIYGVVAYTVESRSQEFGIRLAVGAPVRGLILNVLRDALRPVMAGAAFGLLLSLWSNGLLKSFLFETDSIDPAVFLAAVLLVALTAVVASWQPARRASRFNVAAVLRKE